MSESFQQRLEVVLAGFNGDRATPEAGLTSNDPAVRASSLVALHRLDVLTADTLASFLNDVDQQVRYRVAQLGAHFPTVDITSLLHDTDLYVAEMAAWAHGERESHTDNEVSALISTATTDDRALVREAAVAALGAIGDERGLPAILAGCDDKPAIRRRAVLALAPFEGDAVDAALHRALEDRDWQVRQNAEDMLKVR